MQSFIPQTKVLSVNEEIYQRLFNMIDEGFCIMEILFDDDNKPINWRYLETNPAFAKLSGLSNANGQLITELLPRAEESWLEILGKVALTGESMRFASEAKELNGRWFDAFAFPLGPVENRKVALLFKDITQERQNEEKLNFQAMLLSCVHEAVIALDENRKITYWNGIAEDVLGWSAQEVIGQPVEIVLPNNPSLEKARCSLAQADSYTGIISARHKDGTLLELESRIKNLYGNQGQLLGSVGSHRDMTKRKLELKELQKTKDDLAAEVESLTLLHSLQMRFIRQENLQTIYNDILDAAMKLTQADKGHITVFDQKAGHFRILGTRGFHETTMRHFRQIPRDRTAAGKALRDLLRVIVKDVATNPIFLGTPDLVPLMSEGVSSLQSTPMISTTGNIIGALTTCYLTPHDFSERELRMLDLLARQAADSIEQTTAQEIIQQSEQRARALVKQLRKNDENKNEFISMLSHEFRNPLTSIILNLELLDQVSMEDDRFRKAKAVMKRQADQLSRLVDDLLDITRINRNLIELRTEPMELNDLVSRAVEDYRDQFKNNEVNLELSLSSSPLCLEVDPGRLKQVIGNLLHNALKFTPKGGHVQVTLRESRETGEAHIAIRDDGLGIDPDILPDLFHPFIQADSSLARSRGGLGLGLAIVKGIIELHHGQVSAWSSGIGKGTLIQIRLPLSGVLKTHASPQQTDETTPMGLRMVVVDDIPDITEILSTLLTLLGHEVITAQSGTEGVAKVQALRPDVLICDIGLPDISGYAVAERLRQNPDTADTFMIALSGYAQPEDVKKALKAGFNRHLAKPVDMGSLSKLLAEIKAPLGR